MAASRDALRRPLSVIEAHLGASGHMVGGRFTVADINLAEMIRYASAETGFMAGFPAIAAWLTRLHERPAFKAMWAMRLAEPE
jgi:glutathione S-transferase